jgi:hypothetical protein
MQRPEATAPTKVCDRRRRSVDAPERFYGRAQGKDDCGPNHRWVALSLASMGLTLQLARTLRRRFGAWNGSLFAALGFILLAVTFSSFLPAIDEVPTAFPATLLWKFRIASWGMQLLLWSTMGLLFGWLTECTRWRGTTVADLRCPRGLKREVRCNPGAVPPL